MTEIGREGRDFLLAVHDHLRAGLAEVVRVAGLAVADLRRAADARALVRDLSSGLDPAAVGSYCRQWCAVVDTHHRIEDAALFPELAQADRELRPVLDRLSLEHHGIAEVLVRLDALLVDLVRGNRERVPEVAAALGELEQDLLSHLAYEEELLEAIGRLEVRV